MDQIKGLSFKGEDQQANIKAVNQFIVQTFDFIADPTVNDRQIHIDIFEISQLLSNMIQHSETEEFYLLQRYTSALLNNPKYNISQDEKRIMEDE